MSPTGTTWQSCVFCQESLSLLVQRLQPMQHMQLTIAPRNPLAEGLVPWALLLVQPLQHLQVALSCCAKARSLTPRRRRLLRPGPHQHLQLPCVRCIPCHTVVPGAPLLPRPLQDIKVPSSCCCCAHPCVPCTRLPSLLAACCCATPQPLQYAQAALACCSDARANTPGAGRVLAARPLQDVQVTCARCCCAHAVVTLAACLSCPRQHCASTVNSRSSANT